MVEVTQWDMVTVIAVLLGIFGTLLGFGEKIRKPMQSLTRTSDILAECVKSMEKQFTDFKGYNDKEHDNIWSTVNQHGEAITKHDKEIALLQASKKSS